MISYTVYECEETGKTFKDEQKCLRHERKARRERIKHETFIANKAKVEKSFREELNGIDEEYLKKYIADWLFEHNGAVVEITMADFHYDKLTSNTHHAPIGKPTNWGCKDNLPKGYPGWSGRIEGKMIKPAVAKDYWSKGRHKTLDSFSDYTDSSFSEWSINRMIGLYSGTGGGNGVGFGYHCIMFADDFPYLKKLALKDVLRQGK